MAVFIITDNGPHPAEDWALISATDIFDIRDTSLKGMDLLKAQKLRVSIAECLMPHYSNLQNNEKHCLTKDANHIHSCFDVAEHVEAAMADVVATAKGSPWEAHFANPTVIEAAKLVLTDHLVTAQHIERLWHADNNPECKVSQKYKAAYHG